MTAMIDYNAGNVFSVAAALRRLGEEVVLTDRADVILSADRVVFPGVGYADAAMKELERRGLVDVLRRVEVPFLGICLGMQLMCRHSQEGDVDMLSIVDAPVVRFERDVCRIPFTLLADTVPAEWKGSRQSRSDSLIIVGNGSYLSDMIRSDIYLHETAEGVRILLDKSKPLQCVNNILLTGCFDKKIPLSLSIDKYGYTKSEIEVSLQQYILYCRRENCRLYLGIKSVTDEAVTATLFAVNKKMAYNHTLSVEFPLSILHSGEGRMKGTLYAYTPLQNITEEFFINNINQNEQ